MAREQNIESITIDYPKNKWVTYYQDFYRNKIKSYARLIGKMFK